MIAITMEQVRTAQGTDIDSASALADILTAFEDRITYVARQYATTGSRTDTALLEDLAQMGRIAVWEALPRFTGSTMAQFFTFVDKTLNGTMADARKVETRTGVSRATAQRFEAAVSMTEGDAYAAEMLVQDADAMGGQYRTLSADAAYAARLAYQGLDYLDAPATGGKHDSTSEMVTVGSFIPSAVGNPEEEFTAEDLNSADRERTTQQVHDVLNVMGDQQRVVLMALTGIEPVAEYGTENDDELSADYNLPRDRVRVIRTKGKARFASLYTEEYGI